MTNNFTAGGSDNYPTLGALTDKVNLTSTYEQTLVEYLLGGEFPVENGFPTTQAEDPRYAKAAGEGRIRFLLP